jgi:hypothetical protein
MIRGLGGDRHDVPLLPPFSVSPAPTRSSSHTPEPPGLPSFLRHFPLSATNIASTPSSCFIVASRRHRLEWDETGQGWHRAYAWSRRYRQRSQYVHLIAMPIVVASSPTSSNILIYLNMVGLRRHKPEWNLPLPNSPPQLLSTCTRASRFPSSASRSLLRHLHLPLRLHRWTDRARARTGRVGKGRGGGWPSSICHRALLTMSRRQRAEQCWEGTTTNRTIHHRPCAQRRLSSERTHCPSSPAALLLFFGHGSGDRTTQRPA